MADKFIITEIVSITDPKTGETWECHIKPVSLKEFKPYKPTLEDLIKTYPTFYSLNDDIIEGDKNIYGNFKL